MASSADLEIQCLADAAAYIERHGWPRSRLEGWRSAPVPRVSNPAHWDPYWISPHDEVARSPKYVLSLVADFVQCKACAALRRLPGPLSGKSAPDSLADDWHCTQNTWDPAVAYCKALCGKQPVSRRWRGGRHGDSGRTRRKILISTQVTPPRRTRARRSNP